MELHPIGVAPTERLVRVGRRRREHGRIARQIERVTVPLEHRERVAQPCHHRVGATSGRQLDLEQAELRRRAVVGAPADGGREQLRSEAHPQAGDATGGGAGEEGPFGRQPRVEVILVRPHRSAHGDDEIEAAPIGQRLTRLDLDPRDPRAALDEHVLDDARRLAGLVLQYEGLDGPGW